MNQYVIAIDQGTTSTRAIVFDHSGSIVSSGQMEHEQIFPQAGWVEHNPAEIWNNTREVIGSALSKANLTRHDIAAVGITNQRETAVVWDKTTGEPVYNAIVWQDTRTQPIVDELAEGRRSRAVQAEGGPAAGDLLLRHQDQVDPGQRRRRPGEGRGRRPGLRQHRLLGAVEPDRRRRRRRARHRRHQRLPDHVHGPGDAVSGTRRSCDAFGVPASMMPAIKSSSEVYGTVHTSQLLREVPVAGILGDQQAATFGQAAFDAGRGQEHLRHRLLPDLQHRRGDRPLQERAADHASATSSATRRRTTRWRARSPSPAR